MTSRHALSLLVIVLLLGACGDGSNQRLGRELTAVDSLRIFRSSQEIFKAKNPRNTYGSLGELGAMKAIDADLASGVKHGYKFELRVGDAKGQNKEKLWAVWASPVVPGKTGDRYFYVDQTGIIRTARTRASENSPKLPD